MTHRSESQYGSDRGQHPRDAQGRFESDYEEQQGRRQVNQRRPDSEDYDSRFASQGDRRHDASVGYGQPRDENGRYESFAHTNGGYYDRPRDEHGRFESRGSQYDSSPGMHAGKGPKGYQRSDGRIEEDVNEALTRDGQLDASDIEVKVQNGVVTLSGAVTDRGAKRAAEDLIHDCSGVQDVRNEIRIRRAGDTPAEKVKSQAAAR